MTKIGGPASSNRVSDYYIDTIDDNSPASRSGLRPGDRLVEVDGLDVNVRTFEQVVHLINEAKLRSKLKLLVYPSAILNYGNPDILNERTQMGSNVNMQNMQTVDSRSMPDLTFQQQGVQMQPVGYNGMGGGTNKTIYKQQKRLVLYLFEFKKYITPLTICINITTHSVKIN